MKLLSKAAAFFVSVFLMTACAFVPTVKSPDATQSACSFYTPEWTLGVKPIDERNFCRGARGDDAGLCLLTVGVIIPAGSLLVSGSIVLIGNTIHWLEYQGTCEEAEIQQKLRSFKNGLGALHSEEPSIAFEPQCHVLDTPLNPSCGENRAGGLASL